MPIRFNWTVIKHVWSVWPVNSTLRCLVTKTFWSCLHGHQTNHSQLCLLHRVRTKTVNKKCISHFGFQVSCILHTLKHRWSCCKSQQTSHLWLPQTTCAYFLRGKENNFLVFKGLKNSFVKLNIIDIIDQFLNKQFSKSFQVKSLCYTSQLNYVFQPRVMCHMSLGRTKLTNSLGRPEILHVPLGPVIKCLLTVVAYVLQKTQNLAISCCCMLSYGGRLQNIQRFKTDVKNGRFILQTN